MTVETFIRENVPKKTYTAEEVAILVRIAWSLGKEKSKSEASKSGNIDWTDYDL